MRISTWGAALIVFVFGASSQISSQDAVGNARRKPPLIRTDDIPPEMCQDYVSLYEEKREALDFLTAVPELIQQSLKGRKVLIYDQN